MADFRHPYRLRSIELRDFKSIDHAAFDLRPLSVVVGANSSGKSTLLQAILAVAQAVRAETGAAEFPLNGEFVRLGTLQETRNFLAADTDSPMLIKVGLVDRMRPVPARRVQGLRTWAGEIGVDWSLYLSSDIDPDSGFARVGALELEVSKFNDRSTSQREPVLSLDLSEIAWADSTSSSVPRISGRGLMPGVRPMGVEVPPVNASGRLMDWVTATPARVEAVSLVGGIPVEILSRSSQLDAFSRYWWDAASQLLEEMIQTAKMEYADVMNIEGEQPRRDPRSAINQAYSDIQLLRPDEASAEDELLEYRPLPHNPEFFFYQQLAQLPDKKKRSIAQCMVQIGEPKFRERLRRKFKGQEWVTEEVFFDPSSRSSSELLHRAGLIARRFFEQSVRYLGPLREAPHVLYDPGPTRLDLGVSGEYSAAVLHAQAQTRVRMPTLQGDGEWTDLTSALDFWLQQFGMARHALAQDRGRIGIGLSVTPLHTDRSVDLTSVGVGVSQVLPVILLCLLAPPGTLVVLEQPELHLHPALQQELGDFLLACARSGRQLLVETHSEHLINRLRRRVAEDESHDTQQLVGLLFAEQHDGHTNYRASDVNALGGLDEDWPEGFLDLGAREAQSLVQSSLEKRRRLSRDSQ